jgi:hypothetical protein
MSLLLSQAEITILKKLPYFQRCLYLFGIREGMEEETCIATVSLALLRIGLSVVYGNKYDYPTIQRIKEGLLILGEQGLIQPMNEGIDHPLIFKCWLAPKKLKQYSDTDIQQPAAEKNDVPSGECKTCFVLKVFDNVFNPTCESKVMCTACQLTAASSDFCFYDSNRR